MEALVPLVKVDLGLLTAYDAGGRQVRHDGRPVMDPLTVGEDSGARTGRWLMVPGAARGLARAADLWKSAGGEPFRITDMLRSGLRRKRLRAGFEEWVAAGRPARGRPGWRPTMHDAFVAEQNGSFHGCGCAVDVVVGLLSHPESGQVGSDDALAEFWRVMGAGGFTPVISQPHAAQSESWHFDWLGPLRVVQWAYRTETRGTGSSYTRAAEVGTLLTGQWVGTKIEERTFQAVCAFLWARLPALNDFMDDLPVVFVGRCDGLLGPKTRANEAWLYTLFAEAEIEVVPVWRDMLLAMPELIDRHEGVGEAFRGFLGRDGT